MPDVNAPTRERYGIQFGGPVARDSWQLVRDRNTDAALTQTPFITPTAFNAIKPTGNLVELANIVSGMVDMMSLDGLEVFFGGAPAGAGNTGSWQVLAYDPLYGASDTGKQTITAFVETMLASGTLTLTGPAVGAAGSAGFVGANNIGVGDVVADVIAISTTPAGNVANIELVLPLPTKSMAQLRIIARGHRFLRVLTALTGTTTNLWAAGRRLQGQAIRSR